MFFPLLLGARSGLPPSITLERFVDSITWRQIISDARPPIRAAQRARRGRGPGGDCSSSYGRQAKLIVETQVETQSRGWGEEKGRVEARWLGRIDGSGAAVASLPGARRGGGFVARWSARRWLRCPVLGAAVASLPNVVDRDGEESTRIYEMVANIEINVVREERMSRKRGSIDERSGIGRCAARS